MRAVPYTLGGETYYLAFNGAAMFAFEDAFGGSSAYLEQAGAAGRAGFEAVCRAAAILAEQGELARRALGYDRGHIPTAEQILAWAAPLDTARLRQAVLNAIVAGYGRQVEGGEDADLGLMELEQKKTKS